MDTQPTPGRLDAMLRRLLGPWRDALRSYRSVSSMRWLLLGIVVGACSGLAAVVYFWAVEYFSHLFLTQLAGLSLPSPGGERLYHGGAGAYRPWVVPVLTTLVGLTTGALVSRFIPETMVTGTDGTDGMIDAFHNKGGIIRPLVWIIRGLGSVFTISAGGSAGREGPISQIGAGVGSWLALRLKLSARERRILLLAGAAGGLGAIFRAPLGGALTAIEVIYREDFEAEAILPAVFSSVVAYSIFTLFFGSAPMFAIPQFHFRDARELPFYVALALACSAAGWLYVRSFFYIKYSIFQRIRARIGLTLTTGLGGLAMGVLGVVFPQLLTGGYGWLEQAVLGNLPITVMLLIVLGKTLATSLTIGSGMSGGMFAPALFVGGMSGGAVGFAANRFFPDIVTQPGGYVLVGMAAFFAGVANAPIGPLIMVCELTQGYGLLAPLMLASALCLAINRNVSLYENQVANKFDSPAHLNDSTINILERLQVRDFYRPGRVATLEESITLKALTDIIAGTHESVFPVVNATGDYTGMLAIQDVRRVLFEETLYDVILVSDLARKPAYLRPDYDLYTALMKFVGSDLPQIPVVDVDNKLLGVIDRKDVFAAYSDAMHKVAAGDETLAHAPRAGGKTRTRGQ